MTEHSLSGGSGRDEEVPLRLSAGLQECPACCGTGAERRFLLARLKASSDTRWVGVSSDAMVVAVMTGSPPKGRPYDGRDLGRCLVTQAAAPPEMAERMQPIIDEWTKRMEREEPYHGVKAAREMLSKHAEDVRKLVKECDLGATR